MITTQGGIWGGGGSGGSDEKDDGQSADDNCKKLDAVKAALAYGESDAIHWETAADTLAPVSDKKLGNLLQ